MPAGKPRATIAHLQLMGDPNNKIGRIYNPEAPSILPKDIELKYPRRYSKETRKAWDAIVPSLLLQGVLTEKDLPSLGMMFDHYQNYVDTKKLYDKYKIDLSLPPAELIKQTQAKRHLHAMMHDSMNEFNKLASKFGCTPTDRSKLPINQDHKKEEDPLSIVLGN